jgi:hypothetical protein
MSNDMKKQLALELLATRGRSTWRARRERRRRLRAVLSRV